PGLLFVCHYLLFLCFCSIAHGSSDRSPGSDTLRQAQQKPRPRFRFNLSVGSHGDRGGTDLHPCACLEQFRRHCRKHCVGNLQHRGGGDNVDLDDCDLLLLRESCLPVSSKPCPVSKSAPVPDGGNLAKRFDRGSSLS